MVLRTELPSKGQPANPPLRQSSPANVIVSSFSFLLSLLFKWNAVVQDLQAAMEQVFHQCAIEEWMEENVHPTLQKLQQVVDDLDVAIKTQN